MSETFFVRARFDSRKRPPRQRLSKKSRVSLCMKRGRGTFVSNLPPQAMQQVQVVRTTGSRRPVDKLLIGILKTGVDATQVVITLTTVTFPCTIVGLRWDMGVTCDGGTAPGVFNWVIVVIKDGNVVGNLQASDGNDFYTPEQNVMAFGSSKISRADQGGTRVWSGNTKTMRKMMGGDILQFVCQGSATTTTTVQGCIQFFCKT